MEPFYQSEHASGIMANEHKGGPFCYPAHFHHAVELVLCLAGCVSMRVGSKMGILNPGDMALVFPDIVHSYDTTWGEAHFILSVCAEQQLAAQREILASHSPESPFLSGQSLHEHVSFAVKALPASVREHPEAAYLLFQLALAYAIPQARLARNIQARSSDILYRLVSYMSENYAEPMTLSALAEAMEMDRYQLSRVFSAKLGVGFSEYLASLRIAQAKRMLATSGLPITRVCFDCGFASQRTFNRIFFEQAGLTPGEYRKREEARERNP